MRRYAQLPEVPREYALETGRSWFSIVIPLARTNLVDEQPSFETDLGASTTAVGSGSVARTTDEQYHGAYSLAITPTATTTDGARFFQWNPTPGTTYAFSCKVKGRAGVPYRFYVGNTGAAEQAGVHFRGTGRWQWVGFLWKATAITTRLFLRKDGSADTGVFYWDGVQIEDCSDGILSYTTFISGDEIADVPNQWPAPYYWTGTPNESTSVRSGQTRSGGYVMPLSRYGFLLTAILGLGGFAGTHVATSYAQLDGAQYERTVRGPRDFSLVGRLQGTTPRQLDNLRGRLAAALDRDVTGQQQPLRLLYQSWDRDRATSDLGRLSAVYSGGLAEGVDNLFAETAPLSFTMFLPTVQADHEQGIALDVQDSVSNANRVLLRTAGGTWSAIGTGAAGGSVMAIRRGLDGVYFIGGSFTSFNAVSNTIAIVRYDPTSGTIAAIGTGAGSGNVYDILVAPNGDRYALGTFQNMGGVAAADYVARWDGSAWNAVGTPSAIGTAAAGIQGAFDTSGNLYVPTVGNSTVRKWDGATWSTLGTVAGGGGVVNAIVRGPDGDLFIGGNFTSASGVSATNVARYSFSAGAWQALNGSQPTATVESLTFGLDGVLYAGTLSVAPASSFWRYNGVGWTQIGEISGSVFSVATTAAGLIALGGGFTANDGSLPDGAGYWNGSTVVPLDVDLPSTTDVYRIATEVDGAIAVGYNTSGTATAAGLTTVTNSGSAKAYPTLVINGPSSGTARIYSIRNVTTGRAIYLNLTLAAGDVARLVFDPTNLSFESVALGSIADTVLPGSSEADFFLQPGPNTIAMFAGDSSVTAVLSWRPGYNALAGLTF